MKNVAIAFTVATLGSLTAAHATEASVCTPYLSGTWEMQDTIKAPDGGTIIGSALHTVTFAVEGTYRETHEMSAEGNPNTVTSETSGTWSATAGGSEMDCAITYTPGPDAASGKTSPSYTQTWTMSGPDEMVDADGDHARRKH